MSFRYLIIHHDARYVWDLDLRRFHYFVRLINNTVTDLFSTREDT